MPDEENLSGEFVINSSDNKHDILESDIEKHLKHKHKVKFYTSLCMTPEGVTFENQDSDENIILLIRRDLITNVPWIIVAFILTTIPPIIFLFQDLFTPFFQISQTTQLVAILFYYLIIFGFVLVEFTLWYFNVGLITNKRIVDLDLSGILFKHVSETKLNLIEDVSYTQVGAIRSLFNYGDVLVQTAASYVNFEFDRVPDPARVVRIIAEMIGRKPLK